MRQRCLGQIKLRSWCWRTALLTTAATVLTALPSPAKADPAPDDASTSRLPVAAAARPLTVPRMILAPEGALDVVRASVAAGTFTDLDLSVAFGITDDLAVRALVAPLQLAGPTNMTTGAAGGLQYGQYGGDRGPSAGVTYRFLRGVVEMGAAFDLRVFTLTDFSGVALIPSIPLHVHATRALRFDVSPELNVVRATQHSSVVGGPDTSASKVRVAVPVDVLYNVTESFYLGVDSGLTVDDLSHASTQTGIPLGARAGYAVAGRAGPIVDISPSFELPYLLLPGRTNAVTDTSQYTVGLTVRGYLYL